MNAEAKAATLPLSPAATLGRGYRYRWGIGGLLAVGAFVNYIDRVNISIAATPLSESLHLSPGELGLLLSAYLWTYTVLQLPIGYLIDRIGVRWVMRVAVALWTIASLLTAISGGLGLLLVSRLILGIGEAPAWPASWKAMGYWFPGRERGRCISLLDAASRASNVLGLPVMAYVVSLYGWQSAFVLTGVVSLVYAVAFWVIYRSPAEARRAAKLTATEHEYILEGGAQQETSPSESPWSNVGYLLRRRKTWGLAVGYASYVYVYYLLLSWLPSYLEKSQGMSVLSSGIYSVVPWLVAVITELAVAGWLMDRLIRRGFDPTKTRRAFLVLSMVAALGVAGTVTTHDIVAVMVYLSIGAAGLAVNAPTGQSIITLIAPRGSVASLGGIVNGVANLIGLSAPIVTGLVVEATGSFAGAFAIAGVVTAVGVLSYVVVLGRIEQIPEPSRSLARL
jgi:sugar phosphate permease